MFNIQLPFLLLTTIMKAVFAITSRFSKNYDKGLKNNKIDRC